MLVRGPRCLHASSQYVGKMSFTLAIFYLICLNVSLSHLLLDLCARRLYILAPEPILVFRLGALSGSNSPGMGDLDTAMARTAESSMSRAAARPREIPTAATGAKDTCRMTEGGGEGLLYYICDRNSSTHIAESGGDGYYPDCVGNSTNTWGGPVRATSSLGGCPTPYPPVRGNVPRRSALGAPSCNKRSWEYGKCKYCAKGRIFRQWSSS